VEVVNACTDDGDYERAPLKHFAYTGFCDPAGGSGQDSMTLGIAHMEENIAVLDLLREIKPPFSPQEAAPARYRRRRNGGQYPLADHAKWLLGGGCRRQPGVLGHADVGGLALSGR